MMTREEFERVVRAMRAEGVPLSMPNLMVRTELPRHTIQEWLDDLDQPKPAPDAEARKTAAGKGVDAIDSLRENFGALRDRVVKDAATRVVREKLGLGDEPPADRRSKAKRPQRDLRVAALLGLLGGPIGLLYSAPLLTAGIASAVYVAAVLALIFVPLIGIAALFYLVPLVHLACAALGPAYAWRFNRVGARSALLPS
ncbi:MAG: hypothetical protein Q8S73_23945 [Deltaproteobacteria bacterium]|nr:hypothetical protein [Myxococcales bacterium]MDP3217185.1 hypothetical protein [Deltaproteobacteria bacterium]